MPRQHISNARWRVIEPKLRTADRAYVRNQLESIARDKSAPKQRAWEQEELAYGNLIRLLEANPDEAEFVADLRRRRDAAKAWAAWHRGIKHPLLLCQFRVLRLWQDVTGQRPGYTTPRKRREPDALAGLVGRRRERTPAAYGGVIPFFQAAWEAISGNRLSASQIKSIVIDYNQVMDRLPSDKIEADAEVIGPAPDWIAEFIAYSEEVRVVIQRQS